MSTALLPLPSTVESFSIRVDDLPIVQRTVFQATRDQPRPLAGLMTWVLDRRNLAAAWDRVASAEGADSPGLDGVTCAQLKHRVGPWIADLADCLFHRNYQPGPPRWIDIPKPNKPGESRRIGILNVRDRVVQAALKQVLEPIIEPMFLPGSFGFRPGRSVAGALDAASHGLSAPAGESPRFLWAVPLDISDCFPTIDHDHLTKAFHSIIGDEDLRELFARLVAAGGATVGRLWWQRICGIVQGSPLSPLLCNLALHPIDLSMAKLGQETQSGVAMLRYADDLLVLARDHHLARRAITTIRGVLAKQRQKLKREVGPVEVAKGVEWLGVCLKPRMLVRPDAVEFGYIVPEAKVHSMISRLQEMTNPPSDKIDAAAFNLSKWIVSVNHQLRDWRQAYVFADNAPEVFRVLDDVARDRIGHLLKAVSGANWHEVRRNHYTRLPRGYWTWEVPGARLVVLSSLAPQAPAHLTRRPVWWTSVPETTEGSAS